MGSFCYVCALVYTFFPKKHGWADYFWLAPFYSNFIHCFSWLPCFFPVAGNLSYGLVPGCCCLSFSHFHIGMIISHPRFIEHTIFGSMKMAVWLIRSEE